MTGRNLCDYELVIVFTPEMGEDGLGNAPGKVSEFIKERGGEVVEVTQWGRKKLAYPIKHFTEGNYVLAQIKFEPKRTSELESSLRLTKEVLRHLLVKRDKVVKRDKEAEEV